MSGKARHCSRALLCLLAVCTLALLLPACTPLSTTLGHMLPRKTKAAYRLPARPTLVLVDDPASRLADPALAGLIAAQIVQDLGQNQKALAGKIIPLEQLHSFAARTTDFNKLPIDQIGARLGAEQVVHVHIISVSMGNHPGLLEPAAEARVKVVEVATGTRLFPAATALEPGDEALTSAQGRPVGARIPYRVVDDTRGAESLALRSLAERLGHQVAQLFYDHTPEKSPTRALE